MNRKLWRESLTLATCPAWKCPICGKGVVALVTRSLIDHETVQSKQSHDEEAFDADWIVLGFTAWGTCTYPGCKQQFAIAGKGGYEPFVKDDGDWDYEKHFTPHFCFPMPDMIDIPKKCPEAVAEELRAAFSLFWAQPKACAGRIRVALECLMDHLGMPKKRKNKQGKFDDLTLHARIELFAKHSPTIGSQLMALKWLGNSGSHGSTVKPTDLLDAFEVFEHALGEVIDQRSERVAKLAKTLTKKHKG